MSGERDDLNMDDGDEVVKTGKKRGGLNPFIIKVLSGAAGIVMLTVLMVVVSLVTVKCSSTGASGTSRPDVGITDIRKPKIEHPMTFNLEDPFRQQLHDGKMIQMSITLAFQAKNKKLQMELTQNIPQLRDIIIKTLSKLDSDYFKDTDPLGKFEEDLIKQINRILNEGEIDAIYFQEYTLMGN